MTDENLARLASVTELLPGMPRHLVAVAAGREPASPELVAAADALEEAAERGAMAEMRDRQRAFRERMWNDACPAQCVNATFGRAKPQQDPEGVVSSWLDSPSRVLLLPGPSSHGKTWVAWAVGGQARARGQWVAGWPVPDLMMMLRPSEIDPALPEKTQITAREADLLILDDLGKETPSSWTIEQLWMILNARVRGTTRSLRTIVTTNLGYEELLPMYGDSVMRRLVESAVIARIEGEVITPDPMF
jgi:DNA replication protein DnaC